MFCNTLKGMHVNDQPAQNIAIHLWISRQDASLIVKHDLAYGPSHADVQTHTSHMPCRTCILTCALKPHRSTSHCALPLHFHDHNASAVPIESWACYRRSSWSSQLQLPTAETKTASVSLHQICTLICGGFVCLLLCAVALLATIRRSLAGLAQSRS